MDTDGSRQKFTNIILIIIKILLFINSRFNNLNTYIICNKLLYQKIADNLFNEGYYITNTFNSIYKIYPILYGKKD